MNYLCFIKVALLLPISFFEFWNPRLPSEGLKMRAGQLSLTAHN